MGRPVKRMYIVHYKRVYTRVRVCLYAWAGMWTRNGFIRGTDSSGFSAPHGEMHSVHVDKLAADILHNSAAGEYPIKSIGRGRGDEK